MGKNIFEDNECVRTIFDTIPFMTFIVDDDVRFLFWNTAGAPLIGGENALRRRGGEVLHCIHSTDSPEGCGKGEYCKSCILRNSVNDAFRENKVYRRKAIMDLVQNEKHTELPLLITAAPFIYENQSLCLLMIEEISELIQMGSLLPICSHCKKIRNDKGEWEQVEHYVKANIIDVDFSHGICPECIIKYHPKHIKK
jgi:hypothetical protein